LLPASTFARRFRARSLLQFIGDERLRPPSLHPAKPGATAPDILSAWSRFVVSCSLDQTLADARCRGASSRLENIGAHIIKLPGLTFEDSNLKDKTQFQATSFITHVLKQQRRQLQPFQLERIRKELVLMSLDQLRENSLHDLSTSSATYVSMLALQARRITNLDMKPFPDLKRYAIGRIENASFALMLNAVGALVSVHFLGIVCSTRQKRILE
jgi:hypothetical protein